MMQFVAAADSEYKHLLFQVTGERWTSLRFNAGLGGKKQGNERNCVLWKKTSKQCVKSVRSSVSCNRFEFVFLYTDSNQYSNTAFYTTSSEWQISHNIRSTEVNDYHCGDSTVSLWWSWVLVFMWKPTQMLYQCTHPPPPWQQHSMDWSICSNSRFGSGAGGCCSWTLFVVWQHTLSCWSRTSITRMCCWRVAMECAWFALVFVWMFCVRWLLRTQWHTCGKMNEYLINDRWCQTPGNSPSSNQAKG